MRNLAGETTAHADAYIKDELNEACIPAHSHDRPSQGEVPYSISGYVDGFRFRRAWYYWVVEGPVPVDVAWEMYKDPRGCRDVRVAGHCGCPEPVAPWVEDVDGKLCVTTYHIDSQDGLNLFAEQVLGSRPLPPTEEQKEAARSIARNNRSGEIIYEDGLTEQDYLDAEEEVHKIRRELSDLRHRLDVLSRGPDKGLIPTDSLAHTVSGSLTTALMALYELENRNDDRSFGARAQRTKERWEALYANPTHYVLRETK